MSDNLPRAAHNHCKNIATLTLASKLNKVVVIGLTFSPSANTACPDSTYAATTCTGGYAPALQDIGGTQLDPTKLELQDLRPLPRAP